MWGIWTAQLKPSSLAPFRMAIRRDSQHSILNGSKDYGYAGIDNSSKVHHLLKGINKTEFDLFKTPLRDDFASTVKLYSTFIKQMKSEKPQLNVSVVSFAHGGSSGISNVSNAAVYDHFFEKHA
jgi:hypothetical protein